METVAEIQERLEAKKEKLTRDLAEVNNQLDSIQGRTIPTDKAIIKQILINENYERIPGKGGNPDTILVTVPATVLLTRPQRQLIVYLLQRTESTTDIQFNVLT